MEVAAVGWRAGDLHQWSWVQIQANILFVYEGKKNLPLFSGGGIYTECTKKSKRNQMA